MFAILGGIFIALHGLVHVWYVVLSQQLVAFKPEMGWTGRSWLLTDILGDSPTRSLAGLLFALATIGMVASGIGVMARGEWWRPALVGSAVLSSVTLVLFWDGRADLMAQKGLLGLAINSAILIAMAVL